MFWTTVFPIPEKKYSGYITFLSLDKNSYEIVKKYFGLRWERIRKKQKGEDLLIHLTYKEYVHLFEIGSIYKLPEIKEVVRYIK